MDSRIKDKYNKTLSDNVFPEDWQNPEPKKIYDLVVIGAGTAGLVSAAGAAGLGASVALIERRAMGGDCLNFGCVPSKSLISASRAAYEIKQAEKFGITAGRTRINFGKVMEWVRSRRSSISKNDSAERFRAIGADVFLGKAVFEAGDTVSVNGRKLKFKRAIIATGAVPVRPQIEGIDKTGCFTNETIFEITKLPGKLVVIGGGPLGCELAQAFARLGSRVTMLQDSSHILDREDPDAAEIIQKQLEADGIKLVTGVKIIRAEKKGKKKIIFYESEKTEDSAWADEILTGAGRQPVVEGLGLEKAGVKYDPRKGVYVNDNLRTSNPKIYAAGDVCSAYKFTHTADFSARIAVQNALFFGARKFSSLVIPWCTYTDPEIAHTGIYERDAQAKGMATRTFIVKFSEVDRAIAAGEESGFVKIITKNNTDKILGATIVAKDAGNMISEITLAMNNGTGLSGIAGTIHPYPTLAEAIRKAGDMFNRTRLTPAIKILLKGIIKLK